MKFNLEIYKVYKLKIKLKIVKKFLKMPKLLKMQNNFFCFEFSDL